MRFPLSFTISYSCSKPNGIRVHSMNFIHCPVMLLYKLMNTPISFVSDIFSAHTHTQIRSIAKKQHSKNNSQMIEKTFEKIMNGTFFMTSYRSFYCLRFSRSHWRNTFKFYVRIPVSFFCAAATACLHRCCWCSRFYNISLVIRYCTSVW